MNIHYYDCAIYKYGKEYKIVYLKRFKSDEFHTKKEFENDLEKVGDKFTNNIIRAKSNVLALGLCNEWDYFCTFTLDPQKYDRYNLKKWRKEFTQYIRHQRIATGQKLKYLLIPELHLDGAWHMHGLIQGYSWDNLTKFNPKIHPLDLCRGGYRYHQGITEKFGFNSFGKIKNQGAVSRYLIKYIKKDMASLNIVLGNHLYYASQGLNKPEIVAEGCTTSYLTDIGFKNEFMACNWISQEEAKRISKYMI
ncbi:rolling circle replication-associated protein [Macellibacteroides fermentans]|uniref:rolling circle replication-associated protein n=1 Tax=Macellibacteroides fermentans TaxID=879969 RepID=UPI00406C5B5D